MTILRFISSSFSFSFYLLLCLSFFLYLIFSALHIEAYRMERKKKNNIFKSHIEFLCINAVIVTILGILSFIPLLNLWLLLSSNACLCLRTSTCDLSNVQCVCECVCVCMWMWVCKCFVCHRFKLRVQKIAPTTKTLPWILAIVGNSSKRFLLSFSTNASFSVQFNAKYLTVNKWLSLVLILPQQTHTHFTAFGFKVTIKLKSTSIFLWHSSRLCVCVCVRRTKHNFSGFNSFYRNIFAEWTGRISSVFTLIALSLLLAFTKIVLCKSLKHKAHLFDSFHISSECWMDELNFCVSLEKYRQLHCSDISNAFPMDNENYSFQFTKRKRYYM